MLKAYNEVKAYQRKQQDDAASLTTNDEDIDSTSSGVLGANDQQSDIDFENGEDDASDEQAISPSVSSEDEDRDGVQNQSTLRHAVNDGTLKTENSSSAHAPTIPPSDKTLATEVEELKKLVSDLSSRWGAPSGGLKREYPTYVHVKAEGNASEAPIDLVTSSSEDSQDEKVCSDTGRTEAVGKNTTRLDRSAQRQGTKTARTELRTPSYTKGKQRRDCALRNWASGMRRNAKPERITEEIAESTAENLPQVLANMRVTGFGIIRNFKKITHRTALPMHLDSSDDENENGTPHVTSVFQECNEPDQAQADFPHTAGWNANGSAKTPKHDILFEGVVINSKDWEFKTKMSKVETNDASGRQPRQAMATKSKALEAYNEKYIGQMRDIIKGMFAKEKPRPGFDPANPDNWHMAQNVVWGGTGHQHPHCDQGKAGSFNTEQIFPFVCIHGFGLHEFAMWLLPAQKRREYGFPFRFPKNAMLFMRGDFLHAGAYSQLTRAHLEFWPKAAAGWRRSRNPYWATQESFAIWQAKKVVFLLPDLRTFPFAFPQMSEEDDNGNQNVTYPVKYTEELFPHLDDNYKHKKVKNAIPPAVTNAGLGNFDAVALTRAIVQKGTKRAGSEEPSSKRTRKRPRKQR